jgi:hypothetical protein
MNFLQTGRISLLRVALNIMHCFSWGVRRKISCTSRRMSAKQGKKQVGMGVCQTCTLPNLCQGVAWRRAGGASSRC